MPIHLADVSEKVFGKFHGGSAHSCVYGGLQNYTGFVASPTGQITILQYPGGFFTGPAWIKNIRLPDVETLAGALDCLPVRLRIYGIAGTQFDVGTEPSLETGRRRSRQHASTI